MNHRAPIVIAEISANHLQSLERAKKLISAARDAGAHMVKFQHFRPETITVQGNHPELTISEGSTWGGRRLWDLYEEAMMPWEWTGELVVFCESLGIEWLSSPFDETAVDFLEPYAPTAYKIASFEIVDIPLIRYAASTRRPMILSTGMASLSEIDAAVSAAREAGCEDLTLLRTNSAYPAPIGQMDLIAIRSMQQEWGLPVGLSDHTIGNIAALVSLGLGAVLFEKHLTLSRSDGGPDAGFSSEPEEFRSYTNALSEGALAFGVARFGPSESEQPNIRFRPSLRAVKDIEKGSTFTHENVKSVRPAGGLSPDEISSVVGHVAQETLHLGDPITKELIGSEVPGDH